jgi:hypothetical protein
MTRLRWRRRRAGRRLEDETAYDERYGVRQESRREVRDEDPSADRIGRLSLDHREAGDRAYLVEDGSDALGGDRSRRVAALSPS